METNWFIWSRFLSYPVFYHTQAKNLIIQAFYPFGPVAKLEYYSPGVKTGQRTVRLEITRFPPVTLCE